MQSVKVLHMFVDSHVGKNPQAYGLKLYSLSALRADSNINQILRQFLDWLKEAKASPKAGRGRKQQGACWKAAEGLTAFAPEGAKTVHGCFPCSNN
jgi:hypothetical protein